MLTRLTLSFLLIIIIVLFPVALLLAQEQSKAELAKAAQNPLANMMSFPFQNNTSFNLGEYDRSQNVLNIQPVLPFYKGRLITRTIIPVIWQPDISTEDETSTGLGDIQFTAFYSPESRGFIWGVGGVVMMPTGGENIGSKKWGVGPSVVMLAMPGPWVLGFITNNIWSVAGDEDAADVNMFLLQPFVNYNFGKTGWYLSCAPIITANWKADSGNQWIVPLGGTVGKLLRLGSVGLPVNIQAGAFVNVVKPDWGPDWSSRVMVQILLPK